MIVIFSWYNKSITIAMSFIVVDGPSIWTCQSVCITTQWRSHGGGGGGQMPPPLWFSFFFACQLGGQSWLWWIICRENFRIPPKQCVGVPPPPPRWATYSGLAQNFSARAAVARHFAPPPPPPPSKHPGAALVTTYLLNVPMILRFILLWEILFHSRTLIMSCDIFSFDF